jgi:hypothetical protein
MAAVLPFAEQHDFSVAHPDSSAATAQKKKSLKFT